MNTRVIKHDGNIITITKSRKPNKKYAATIKFKSSRDESNKSGNIKTVYFGGIKVENGKYIPYEQYKDSTGLGYYSKYDHLDPKRRENYYKRHGWYAIPYTADWFSKRFLWS